jgi:hypothetical protein
MFMVRRKNEHALQNYLTKNNGINLKKIDSSLTLLDIEHKFRSGRIDILAKRDDKLIGIELKSSDYQTRGICAQLLNYLNYLTPGNGEVYFIAPKIKYGIYSTLRNFYEDKKLKLFEYEQRNNSLVFKEIYPLDLDDSRALNIFSYQHSELLNTELIKKEKIRKGIEIIVKDSKQAKLINTILDDGKPVQKQIEDITDSIFDIIPSRKYSFLKTAYELLKLI